jgi:hypothetical protein
MAKPLFREETIAELTLADDDCVEIIMSDEEELPGAFAPGFFPGQESQAEEIQKLVGELDPLDQEILRRALQQAITEPPHDSRAVFGKQQTDYEIGALGLEIKDDAMDERERDGPLRVSPVGVVFIFTLPSDS